MAVWWARSVRFGELPHPQPVTQAGAPFGQVHGHDLPAGKAHLCRGEFLLGPIRAGEFVIGQAGDALALHALEEIRRVAFAIEYDGEAMLQRIVRGWLTQQLARQTLLQARDDLLLDDRNQPRIDRLIDDEEGLPVHGVDPVVGGRPQTQALAGDTVAWQLALVAVVDTHMPVDVEHTRLLRSGGHPALAQRRVPLRRAIVLGQQLNLGAQGAHLRDPIQPQELAPLPGSLIAQCLDRLQPRQRHEGEQQQQAVEPIVAFGQLQMALNAFEQSNGEQRRQRTQQAAIGHVQRRSKIRRHRIELADAGGQPALNIRCRHAHGGGAVGGRALALARQRGGSVFFTGLCRRPARTALESVSRLTPKQSATSAVSRPSSSNCWASANTAGVSTAGPRRLRDV